MTLTEAREKHPPGTYILSKKHGEDALYRIRDYYLSDWPYDWYASVELMAWEGDWPAYWKLQRQKRIDLNDIRPVENPLMVIALAAL